MQRYILGRLGQSVVSMFVVLLVVHIAVMRAYLGLDRPWPVQYWTFIAQALQGDCGRSGW